MNKTKRIITVFCILGLLFTMSAWGSIAVDQQSSNVKPQLHIKESNFVPAGRSSMKNDISTVQQTSLNCLQGPTDADVQVTFAEGFDMQPAIANDGTGNLLLGYSGDPMGNGEYNIWFTSSADQGATWAENAMAWQIPMPEKPSLDHWGGTRFFGTMVPDPSDYDGSAMYVMECTDPADFENGYAMTYWTWDNVGDGYLNFQDISIACDNALEEYAFGGISIIGDRGSDFSAIPMFSYQATEDGTAWIYYSSDEENNTLYENCQSTATDIDPVTHESYSLWNPVNTSTEIHDMYFYKFDFATWDEYEGYPIHPGLADGMFYSGNDDLNLDVSANNDNVIIVSQTDGDITCYYSNDGLGNISMSVIVSTDADELYPQVTHTGQNQAVCLFVKDANVFTVTTEDREAT